MKNYSKFSFVQCTGMLMLIALFITGCKDSEKAQSYINPPFPELTPQFRSFTHNPATPDTIELNMGTKLLIPANAFVDSAGNFVKESVELKYREFRNAAEIFMAGIPMNYNAQGINTALETAGMFELRAFAKNNELQLAPGKQITVKMGSRVEGANYNFFGFNENSGKWEFMGYPKTQPNPEYEKIEKNIAKLKKTQKYPLGDEFFVFDYSAAFDITYYELGKKYNKRKMKRRLKKYGAAMYNLYTRERLNYRGRYYRAQFLLWEKVSKGKLPRWVRKQRANTEIKKLGGNVYLLSIKHKDKKYSFRAAIKMPLKALYAYSPDYLKNHYEEAMQEVEKENKRMATEAKVYRTFKMSKLGIGNFDCLYKPEKAFYAKANFDLPFTEDQKMYTNGRIFIIPGSKKSLFTLNGFQDNRIFLDQKDEALRMFTLLPGGEIGIIDNAQLSKLNYESLSQEQMPKIKLSFRKWNKSVTQKDDVLELFGI